MIGLMGVRPPITRGVGEATGFDLPINAGINRMLADEFGLTWADSVFDKIAADKIAIDNFFLIKLFVSI